MAVGDRTVAHGTFTVEREYPHPVERVFAAWTTPEAKSAWFAQAEDFNAETLAFSLDFRVGGVERLEARLVSGSRLTVETHFADIVPNKRIVATYDVLINDRRISVSLWSTELFATDEGTRLVTTEDGAFLDGLDDSENRLIGVERDFDQLAKYLERSALALAER